MQYKFFYFLPLIMVCGLAYPYNQNDLLNSQTNYQTAKNNDDTSKDQLKSAQEDLSAAESYYKKTESELRFAATDLKRKQESTVIAKQNAAKSATTLNTAGLQVENMWNQVNGKSTTQPTQ